MFNDTATTGIYALSLRAALLMSGGCVLLEQRPAKGIWGGLWSFPECPAEETTAAFCRRYLGTAVTIDQPWPALRHGFTHFEDRKSTRLNSSHCSISFAVFCFKKKIFTTFYDSFNYLSIPLFSLSFFTPSITSFYPLLIIFLFLS